MITVVQLIKTCDACPAQWEGQTDAGEPVYIRYRWGRLMVEVNEVPVFGKLVGDGLDGMMTEKELAMYTQGEVEFTLAGKNNATPH